MTALRCKSLPEDSFQLAQILKSGDIVNVDVTTIVNGYYADASRMFMIGEVDEVKLSLALSNLIENAAFETKIISCKNLLENGTELADALRESQILTGSYARIASIAQKAGTLDEAMSHISDEYEYSVNNKINQLIALLEPTLVIVLSLIVGVILFSVMIPLLGILSGL